MAIVAGVFLGAARGPLTAWHYVTSLIFQLFAPAMVGVIADVTFDFVEEPSPRLEKLKPFLLPFRIVYILYAIVLLIVGVGLMVKDGRAGTG
jgi:hypothetical protein